jgi:aerobic carbon-monoxide dehydrogenase medium subunit
MVTVAGMKPPLFAYHAPESVEEALALLAEHGDEAKVLAGGQSLLPLLSLRLARPSVLIDINGLDAMASIGNGAGLRLGALVRHRAIERSETVRSGNPLLASAVRFIGHATIRNRGTIGGSVAHADPAAELPAVLLALDGEVEVRSLRGSRTIPTEALFQGFLTTSLEADELLTAVSVPAWVEGTGWSFQEFSRRSGDFAVAGVAVEMRLDGDDRIGDVRIAFSGVAPTPVRARTVERALVGESPSAEVFAGAAGEATADLDPPSDLHGTTNYRRYLARSLVRRSLLEAYGRAKEAR